MQEGLGNYKYQCKKDWEIISINVGGIGKLSLSMQEGLGNYKYQCKKDWEIININVERIGKL